MLVQMFEVKATNEQLPAIQDNKGNWYFSAKETCLFAEVADSTNATKWVKNNIPPKWYLEIKTPGKEGRPSLYLTKPGFYYAVCQGKSLKAMTFRDWVFEDLLVKLEASGGYIMPTATSEQLQALQVQIAEQQQQIKALSAQTKTFKACIFSDNVLTSLKQLHKQGYTLEQEHRELIAISLNHFDIWCNYDGDSHAWRQKAFYDSRVEWLPQVIWKFYEYMRLTKKPYAIKFANDFKEQLAATNQVIEDLYFEDYLDRKLSVSYY